LIRPRAAASSRPKTGRLGRRTLIVVANAGPMTFLEADDGAIVPERNSGGLVTALLGLSRRTELRWIACARKAADSRWGEGDIELGETGGKLWLKLLRPSKEAYHGYYSIIANPLLWFLQHSMWDVPKQPIIDRTTWHAWNEGYVAVNRLFAEAVVQEIEAARSRPLVMIQDYHLYLVGRNIREGFRGRRQPSLLHFIHIPWPGPEYWHILPSAMRTAILDGLCSVDVLGFQTRLDALNFLRTCESHLHHSRVSYRTGQVVYKDHITHVRDYPISIDVESLKKQAQSEEVAAHLEEISSLTGDRRLIVRIERIEPSKNIVRGFLAFEELLSTHPEYRERLQFLSILVPSRLEMEEYQTYLDEVMAVVGRINAAFTHSGWEPIRLLVGDDYARAIAALRRYDILLVNPIADGMNLVAKEGPIVNERDGVLVLSEHAGARQQLDVGALIIPPCDVYSTYQALLEALTMGPEKRAELIGKLRRVVEREDIFHWMEQQLDTVFSLRK